MAESDVVEVAYDAFISQVDHNLQTAGLSSDLTAAAVTAVSAAVAAIISQANEKVTESDIGEESKTALTEAITALTTSAALGASTNTAILAALRDMARDACGKAKMLWLGSPINTVLRNVKTNEMATRVITADQGIPLWTVTKPDGSKWETHDTVLQPEADWVCIYDPAVQTTPDPTTPDQGSEGS